MPLRRGYRLIAGALSCVLAGCARQDRSFRDQEVRSDPAPSRRFTSGRITRCRGPIRLLRPRRPERLTAAAPAGGLPTAEPAPTRLPAAVRATAWLPTGTPTTRLPAGTAAGLSAGTAA